MSSQTYGLRAALERIAAETFDPWARRVAEAALEEYENARLVEASGGDEAHARRVRDVARKARGE